MSDQPSIILAASSKTSHEGPSGHLVVSNVITALAELEGVDLGLLRSPSRETTTQDDNLVSKHGLRLLDWTGDNSAEFSGPKAAWKFFEEFELFPGYVVRGWGDAKGRLAFGLDNDRVTFELHDPSAGLLINGTPDKVTLALRDALPQVLSESLIGAPLERLVAWRPACGPGNPIVSIDEEDGIQVVTVSTMAVTIPHTLIGKGRETSLPSSETT